MTFSPDKSLLAVGLLNGHIELWQVSDSSLINTLEGHTGAITSLDFGPDGETVVSGSVDTTIRLWQVRDGEELITLEEHTEPISQVRFSPDGTTLASASWDTTVRLWQVSDGEVLYTLDHFPHQVTDVAFAPDGNTLISTAGDLLRLWQVSDGSVVGTPIEAHAGAITSVSFAPDGQAFITSSDDRTVRIWQTDTGTLLNTFEIGVPIRNTAIIANSSIVAVDVGYVQLWWISTGEQLESVTGRGMTFSADKRHLATVNFNQDTQFYSSIQLWQMPVLADDAPQVNGASS